MVVDVHLLSLGWSRVHLLTFTVRTHFSPCGLAHGLFGRLSHSLTLNAINNVLHLLIIEINHLVVVDPEILGTQLSLVFLPYLFQVLTLGIEHEVSGCTAMLVNIRFIDQVLALLLVISSVVLPQKQTFFVK